MLRRRTDWTWYREWTAGVWSDRTVIGKARDSGAAAVVMRMDRITSVMLHGAYRAGVGRALGVTTALRLPPRFEPQRLRQDLAKVNPSLWAQHETGYHDGSWSAVSLIGNSEDPRDIHVAEGLPFVETELLERTPYFREVLARFSGGKRRARLMKIAAGGRIFEHCDEGLSVDDGVARLHVPVQSEPGNVFWLAGSPVPFRVGETWYGDFSFPHEAENRSSVDRVHFVFDVFLDDSLRAMFPNGYFDSARRRRMARKLSGRGSAAVGWARRGAKNALSAAGVIRP